VKGEVAKDIGRDRVDGRVKSGESTSSRTICVFRTAHDGDDDDDVDGVGYKMY
jgi:hypothetical protein